MYKSYNAKFSIIRDNHHGVRTYTFYDKSLVQALLWRCSGFELVGLELARRASLAVD